MKKKTAEALLGGKDGSEVEGLTCLLLPRRPHGAATPDSPTSASGDPIAALPAGSIVYPCRLNRSWQSP